MKFSVRAELAAAVRAVNAAFNRLPESAKTRMDLSVDGLEGEIDMAIRAGDRDRAVKAIAAWRDHWLDNFKAAMAEQIGAP
jgi:hypothetical protein